MYTVGDNWLVCGMTPVVTKTSNSQTSCHRPKYSSPLPIRYSRGKKAVPFKVSPPPPPPPPPPPIFRVPTLSSSASRLLPCCLLLWKVPCVPDIKPHFHVPLPPPQPPNPHSNLPVIAFVVVYLYVQTVTVPTAISDCKRNIK